MDGLRRAIPLRPESAVSIISRSLAAERHAERERERRQVQGAMSRAEYRGQASERQAQARALRAQGRSIRSIAQELGVSVGAVAGYLND